MKKKALWFVSITQIKYSVIKVINELKPYTQNKTKTIHEIVSEPNASTSQFQTITVRDSSWQDTP